MQKLFSRKTTLTVESSAMQEEGEHIDEAKIDEGKIQSAIAKAKEVDIDKLMRAFVEMLKAYSDLAQRIGTIQKDNNEAFESLTYLGSMAPQMVKMLSEKAPPAEFGAFIKAFMDLLELAPKLDELMKLPAEEKIEIGKRISEIAFTLEEMINKMAEVEKSGKTT